MTNPDDCPPDCAHCAENVEMLRGNPVTVISSVVIMAAGLVAVKVYEYDWDRRRRKVVAS